MPIRNVSIQRARFISGGCYNQENKKSASRIKGVGSLRCYKNSLSKILEIFLSLYWNFTILWDTIRNYPSSPWIWWCDFLTTAKPCKWETDSQNGNEKHSNEIWLRWTYYTCVQLGLRAGGRNSETKKFKDMHSSEQFHILLEGNWQRIRQQQAEFPTRVYQIPFWTESNLKRGRLAL